MHETNLLSQSRGSPSAAQSWSTTPFLERRLCTCCPSPPSLGGCLWFGLEIRGPSRSAIATAAATARIATTTTSPGLTPGLGPGTGAPCTSWIPGRWAGPATREVEWSALGWLLRIIMSLLHYYATIITYYSCRLLRIITSLFLYYYVLLHCYYTIITYYYIIITSLLRIIAIPLLRIIAMPLLRIIPIVECQ